MNLVLKSVLQGIASFLIGGLVCSTILFSCAADAQTLTTATPDFDPTPLFFLAFAAAAVAAIVVIRRKSPAKFDAAKANVEHTIGDGVEALEARVGKYVHGFEAFASEHKVPPALHLPPTAPVFQQIIAAVKAQTDNATLAASPAPPPAAAPVPSYLLDNRTLKA